LKNGLLAVALPEPEVAQLMQRAGQATGYLLTVDLECRLIKDDLGFVASFEIDDFHRYCLMNGLDEIGLTVEHETQITAYEATRSIWLPQAS
jgi:3-isopropylmalate/(R)-2-methylmalate dehydratase small subunit